jgi:hypothetical protein
MRHVMVEDELELLITVVVGAGDDQQARSACQDLQSRIGGRVVVASDCSDEDPGCWSVTISRLTGKRVGVNDAAVLSDVVRAVMRDLGPDRATQEVSCDPPTAWIVLDDPELVGRLVPGGERLLVEAWVGGSWLPAHRAQPVGPSLAADNDDPDVVMPTPAPPAQDPASVWIPPELVKSINNNARARIHKVTPRLRMRVDVVADRPAGAEWHARAVAGRISRTANVSSIHPIGRQLISVYMDLGPTVAPPAQAVLMAVSALGRPGWSPLGWMGDTAVTRWWAQSRLPSGIVFMELTAGSAGHTG